MATMSVYTNSAATKKVALGLEELLVQPRLGD